MRRAAALLVLALASGCVDTGGAAAEKGSGSGSAPAPPDDDGAVEDAIPMALFDGATLAANLRQALRGADYASLPQRQDEAAYIEAATQTETVDPTFSAAVIALPGRAEGQIAADAEAVRALLDRLFGAGGVFNGREVKAALYAFGDGSAKSYVEVAHDAAAAYPYTADIYATPGTAGAMLRTTRVEVARGADGARKSRILHYAQPADAKLAAFVTLDVDEAGHTFSAAVAYAQASSERPRATLLQTRDYHDAGGGDLRLVQGAIRWELAAEPVVVDDGSVPPPRYYAPLTGDVELFRSLRAGASGPTAQEATYAVAPAAPQPYPSVMLAFLTTLVRQEGVNQQCANSGDLFRDAFKAAGKPVPADVAALPADICRARTATTDAAVGAAVKASCDAGVNLALDVTFPSAGKRTYYLCTKYFEASLLANPIISTLSPDGVATLEAHPTPQHTALATRLAAEPALDASPLAQPEALSFDRPSLSRERQAAAVAP
jgi:hypothetical protein